MLVTTIAYGFGSRTISTSVVGVADVTGLTAALVAKADRARITAATDALRYRYDGGDPTSTVGHYLPANGGTLVEGQENIARLRFIRTGASDAEITITLEKY